MALILLLNSATCLSLWPDRPARSRSAPVVAGDYVIRSRESDVGAVPRHPVRSALAAISPTMADERVVLADRAACPVGTVPSQGVAAGCYQSKRSARSRQEVPAIIDRVLRAGEGK